MNIRGIVGTSISPLSDVHLQQPSKVPSGVEPAALPGASAWQPWRPGMLLYKLEQLEQQNPDQFKQIVARLADSLQQIADKSGNVQGPAAQLAQVFKQAADTGDMSALGQLLHHPTLATHLHDAASGESTIGDMPTASQMHPFGSILCVHQNGGIATALRAAIHEINAALQSKTTSPAPSSTVTTNADAPSNAASSSDAPNTVALSSVVNASVTSSAGNPVSLANATTQSTIAAIENAAIVAIKSA